VNITRGDFERLQPGKYLNDTLIEFGLKYVLTDCRALRTEDFHLQVVAQ
jgi:Ulp1 family protease